MNPRKLSLLGALLSAAALALSACGSSGAGGADTITLYSGQHEQTTAALVKAFERQTGIKVSVRSGDEAELGNQIMQEGSSSPADVFYTENTPVLEALREHGLLAPVEAATLAAVPGRYDSAQGDWVGVSARVSVLVYNTSQVKPAQLPGSILELAEPRWRGKVGFAPSETDFQPLITAIVKLDGNAAAERWLKGLQANGKIYPDNETVVAQVNNGESAVGPINHYYWYRLRTEVGAGAVHSALHYYDPGDPGDLVDVSGAAVLRSSSHQAAAQKLLAFLVSRTGQETIAHSHSYEYPLRPGVAPAPGLRPFAQLRPAALTPSELGDGSQALALEQKLGLL
ncbi:MAG TPA: iron ABC transporter substrate-binding protein [Solirubrobacteraceae bacterium]|jgi:iron(III) transport system substrate-binding protein|nr:iron ABC transporter substrate-binding protein [Solirubrobacteraceae bacterium]